MAYLARANSSKINADQLEIDPKTDTNQFRKLSLLYSEHTLLPSGDSLLGGHQKDGFGVEQTSISDYNEERWIPRLLCKMIASILPS